MLTKRRFALAILGLCLPGSGCSMFHSAANNLVYAPWRYSDHQERHESTSLHREMALAAWERFQERNPHVPDTFSYEQGFLDGYVDYLDYGPGQRPILPPREYWNTRFESPAGYHQVQDWFAGFHDGTTLADASGVRNFVTVPSTLCVPPQWPPGGEAPGSEVPGRIRGDHEILPGGESLPNSILVPEASLPKRVSGEPRLAKSSRPTTPTRADVQSLPAVLPGPADQPQAVQAPLSPPPPRAAPVRLAVQPNRAERLALTGPQPKFAEQRPALPQASAQAKPGLHPNSDQDSMPVRLPLITREVQQPPRPQLAQVAISPAIPPTVVNPRSLGARTAAPEATAPVASPARAPESRPAERSKSSLQPAAVEVAKPGDAEKVLAKASPVVAKQPVLTHESQTADREKANLKPQPNQNGNLQDQLAAAPQTDAPETTPARGATQPTEAPRQSLPSAPIPQVSLSEERPQRSDAAPSQSASSLDQRLQSLGRAPDSPQPSKAQSPPVEAAPCTTSDGDPGRQPKRPVLQGAEVMPRPLAGRSLPDATRPALYDAGRVERLPAVAPFDPPRISQEPRPGKSAAGPVETDEIRLIQMLKRD